MMDKLKPCPFCGAEAELREKPNENPQSGTMYNIRCSRQHCMGRNTKWLLDKHELARAWNIRA